MRKTRKSEFERYAAMITGKAVTTTAERVKPKVKSGQKETGKDGVCADCLKYLKSLEMYYPCKAERINTGGGYTQDGRYMQYGKAGRADIYFTLAGRIFYIECKAGSGGWLSQEQLRFKTDVFAAGAAFWVVCSAEELKDLLTPVLATTTKKPGVADFDNDPELRI